MPIPKQDLLTRYAGEAKALAEAFERSFAETKVADAWRPELLAPDVPSTAGGVQATLHLRLVPASGPAFVVGHANPKAASAELRTFEHADRLHRERFGASIAIPRDAYDDFLGVAEKFFVDQELEVRRVGPPSLPPPSIPPAARRLAPILLSIVAIVVLVAVFLWLKH